MCGIVGYAGHRPAVPLVVEELHRLEYRGYDSAGVACVQQGKFRVVKAEGMEMKLHSKSEYKAKVAAENGTAAAPAADNTVDAAVIVEALGGKDNILKVTNCYTRLRTELADPDKVQDDVLKNQTGASAVIHKGKNIQVVYGLKVNAVRKAVDAELGLSGEE